MNPATSGVSMSLADQQQWCPTSVQVTVLQARGLRTKGKSGTNDAYAVMQVGKEKFQTSVVEKCVAPVWKEEAAFDLPGGGGGGGADKCTLHVHVLHRALVGPDKLLGQAVINLLQLSEDKTRNKTEWFKLLDKTGKADKDRGEVLVDIQFMRNNMTASMFDLSAAGKSKSRLGKFKDKVRGKKKESDSASNMVPSLTQVLTDSEGEENGDGEVTEGKDEKKKKHKMKSLFSPKSNLQKNMSQSMSVLPAKNSSLSGSQSSGLNVDTSEGKKKFKFKIHKRSGSSGNKDPPSGHQKQGTVEQSNLCINGSHVYCEEPPPRTSRIGSNFSLASSGHGSMEDVPESSPPSVDSLRGVRQCSPWTEEEEEEVENKKEDVGEVRGEEEERIRMEEERRRKEEEEERARRQAEELERLAEERRRQEEQEEKLRKEEEERIRREEEERALEERRRQEEKERLRREEVERERLAEEKRRLEEQERRRIQEEERAQEERRRQEEEERLRREEAERERLKEEKRRLEEQERKRIEEEVKRQREQEERAQEERRRQEEAERLRREEEERERLREEKRKLEELERRRIKEEEKRQREEEERAQEERRRQEEEERLRREEEERERLEKEKRRLEEERRIEEERIRKEAEERAEEERRRRRQEEEEMVRRQEEERDLKRRLEEQQMRQREEEERIRMEEERAQEERRRQEEEELKLAEEKRRLEEEKRRIEEEKVRKEAEERAEEERRRREEEEMRRQEEEREEKRRLEAQERKRREEEERIKKEEEERARREKEEFERLLEEKRKLEEEERKKIEAEEKIRREEEERIRMEEERRRKEEEERERLAEEKRKLEEQERRRIEEEEKRQREEEEERIRKEEARRQEEERARKEKEEYERQVEEKKRQEEQEKKRMEEEERTRREEKAEKERREEEARKLEKEKLAKDAEEQKKKENKTKPKAPVRKPNVAVKSPAGVTSTNPFDEDEGEEIPDSPVGPDSSTAKVSTVQQRIQSAASPVRSNPVSTDEKDPIGTQREKRPAPRPPGSNQAERQSQREQDASTRHLAQINKQSKDRDVKTGSVLPQRLVQMIAPLSRSPTDAKNTQSLTQSSTTRGTSNAAKHGKRLAPSRPRSAEEEPPSEHKTAPSPDGSISKKSVSEAKQAPIVYGLNPFEDDEDENVAQDNTTSSGDTGSVQWPPAVSQAADKDAASHAKTKSSKIRAPPVPAQKAATSSTSVEQNTEGGHVTDDKGVTEPDNSSRDPETVNPVSDQEASLQESQPVTVTVQNAGEEAGGKKEGPPVASRRLQPVKPLNPLEQQSVSVVEGEKENKSTEILCEVQEKTKVNDTELKGPFSQLTQEELISLVIKQETQLAQRDKKISELEQYIDNLLVRVMEEQPSILMSLNSMK